LLIKYNVNVV